MPASIRARTGDGSGARAERVDAPCPPPFPPPRRCIAHPSQLPRRGGGFEFSREGGRQSRPPSLDLIPSPARRKSFTIPPQRGRGRGGGRRVVVMCPYVLEQAETLEIQQTQSLLHAGRRRGPMAGCIIAAP